MLYKRVIQRTIFKLFDGPQFSFSTLPLKWVELSEVSKKSSVGNSVRLMSYNILAESNIRIDMYPKCTKFDLDWKRRQLIVVKNIQQIDPDIACFQEFQPKDSANFIKMLQDLSYEHTAKTKSDPKVEGEACFWKKDKFDLLHDFKIEMQLSEKIHELSFMNRETIAHITVLKCKTQERTLIIANTHMLYHMKRGEFKLGQAMILLRGVDKVRELCTQNGYPNINSFICGDFNSIPNSILYNLFTQESINLERVNLVHISNQTHAVKVMSLSSQMKEWEHFHEITKKHEIKPIGIDSQNTNFMLKDRDVHYLKCIHLDIDKSEMIIQIAPTKMRSDVYLITSEHKGATYDSAYAYVYKNIYHSYPDDQDISHVNKMISKIRKNSTKQFDPELLTFESSLTHFTKESKATVDYIWFDKNNTMKPYRILETIDYFTFTRHQGFPNNIYPSDHVPLVGDFL